MRASRLVPLFTLLVPFSPNVGADELLPPPAGIERLVEKPPPKIWCGGVELGILGSDGNSENFKVRTGFNAKRDTGESLLKLDFLYAYGTANGINNENRALFNARQEWRLRDSPWSVFVSTQAEYDEFRAYDLRLAAHTGLAYTFIKDDQTLLKGRLGAGAAREVGGPENRIMPEALLGFDFERKLNTLGKITSTFDLYPDLGEFGEYRFEGRLAYEVCIDPDLNLTLKMGLLDRYDSTPEGRKPNDVEYFVTLLWKF